MPELNLKLNGISDLPPWEAGTRWTDCINMVMRRGFADRVRGDDATGVTVPVALSYLINMFGTFNWWLMAGSSAVSIWDGSGAADNVTPTDYASSVKGGLTGGTLNGYGILNSIDRP